MTDFASCHIETVDVREVWSGWSVNTAPEVSASVRFVLENPGGIGPGPEISLSFSLADVDDQALERIEERFLEASLAILRRIVAESPDGLRECMARSRAARPPI